MKCMPVEQLYAHVLMFTDDTLIFILFFSLLLMLLLLRIDLSTQSHGLQHVYFFPLTAIKYISTPFLHLLTR